MNIRIGTSRAARPVLVMTMAMSMATGPARAEADEALGGADEVAFEPSVSLEFSPGMLQSHPDTGVEAADPGASAPLPPAEPSGWRFDSYAAGWVPLKIKGSVDVGPTVTDIDVDLSTLLDDLDMLFEGGMSLSNGHWTIMAWGLYIKLGTDVESTVPFLGQFDTSLDFEFTLIDVAVAYRVYDGPLGSGESSTWGVDILGGVRYYHAELDISERAPGGFDPMLSENDDWFDPVVGMQLVFDISEKFTATVRGDIGGFGIGSASDLTWSVTALGKFKLSPKIDLVAGFRYLDFDWKTGSGTSRVGYDWRIYGPLAGVSIEF